MTGSCRNGAICGTTWAHGSHRPRAGGTRAHFGNRKQDCAGAASGQAAVKFCTIWRCPLVLHPCFKKTQRGDFPGGPVLRLCSQCRVQSPGWGANLMPQRRSRVLQLSQITNKQQKTGPEKPEPHGREKSHQDTEQATGVGAAFRGGGQSLGRGEQRLHPPRTRSSGPSSLPLTSSICVLPSSCQTELHVLGSMSPGS